MTPVITRVRHDLVRRSLTVTATERLTPHMQRVTLAGADLAGFASLGFDDHIKLSFPGLVDGDAPQRRDYTPRRYDAARGELVVDFALHEAGVATVWALTARVGDRLQIGGPRGSQVIGGDIAQWLLIGDETALPAIGRKIDEATVPVTAVVAVPGPQEAQVFANPALTAHWVHRPATQADDPAALLRVVQGLTLPAQTFVWIAAEARVARALRQHFVEDRQHPLPWLKASGYWVRGEADGHVNLD